MSITRFDFIAGDGKKIQGFKWLPAGNTTAVLQIVHGMAEHAERYDDFADFLTRQGLAVYACDLRGHGKTAGNTEACGYFASDDGWMWVADDVSELSAEIKVEYPGKPLFLLGHSMGSFIARTCIALKGDEYSGCILSGTATHPPILLSAAGAIASLQRLLSGGHHRSRLLDKLSFGAYNKRIKTPRTKFDWLSRDNDIVDRYDADPYCGFVCTAGFFRDLFMGLKFINNVANISKTPVELPLLFMAGSEDPVSNYTEGMVEASDRFKKAGVSDITIKIYDGCRHEILNETNRQEVYNDILHWINARIG